jgi:hypothetical protein
MIPMSVAEDDHHGDDGGAVVAVADIDVRTTNTTTVPVVLLPSDHLLPAAPASKSQSLAGRLLVRYSREPIEWRLKWADRCH